jgi:hypothetical protein
MQPEDTHRTTTTTNIFDNLPAFRTVPEITSNELTCYLSTDPEDMKNEDLLKWWVERWHIYPKLSRMALDYHTVPSKYLYFLSSALSSYHSVNRYFR